MTCLVWFPVWNSKVTKPDWIFVLLKSWLSVWSQLSYSYLEDESLKTKVTLFVFSSFFNVDLKVMEPSLYASFSVLVPFLLPDDIPSEWLILVLKDSFIFFF